MKYFGVNLRDTGKGFKLTKENYIQRRNKSSFNSYTIYTDEYVDWLIKRAELNLELNLKYMECIDKEDFYKELKRFLNRFKEFKEVKDLNEYKGVPGYYLMVLGEYKQVYIGTSKDIRKRVMNHWTRQKELDRLVLGSLEVSKISIDSFRALDTTQIFVHESSDLYSYEDKYINGFDDRYLLNRTVGGRLGGLFEAVTKGKTRGDLMKKFADEKRKEINKLEKEGEYLRKNGLCIETL